jgi:hypothetical protein
MSRVNETLSRCRIPSKTFLLLQVRCAVFNGKLGSGFAQIFKADSGLSWIKLHGSMMAPLESRSNRLGIYSSIRSAKTD